MEIEDKLILILILLAFSGFMMSMSDDSFRLFSGCVYGWCISSLLYKLHRGVLRLDN